MPGFGKGPGLGISACIALTTDPLGLPVLLLDTLTESVKTDSLHSTCDCTCAHSRPFR